jgi:hypothetical protein
LGNVSIEHNNFKLNLSIKNGLKMDFTEIRNPDIKPDLNPKSGLNLDLNLKSGFKTSFESEIWISNRF